MSALRLAATAALALALSGCAYDYMQHTDRVSYSAGDAVHANLERETTNPSRRTARTVTGLGKNGIVVSGATGSSSGAPPASN